MKDYLIGALNSWTIRFALLLAVLGVVEANVSVFAQYMSASAYGWFTMAVGVVVAVLRIITTLPLNQR